MNCDIIESYIEKVYGYAVNRTYSRDEADELAQEILFTVVSQLPKLRDESKFEPWLWGIAGNVTKSFRRKLGKQRAMYSYDMLEAMSYEDEYFDENEEIYDLLRTKIAMLSAIYREIIILYYYDGLSAKAISEKLNIPEGTVRWRLSEGRKKLKKECAEMNETALKPIKMYLGMYGSGNYNGKGIPYPTVYIDDALSQNILYYCYEKSCTVEELAKLCGVPAYYVEDRMDNLIKREAVIEASKGKYRTDFIIFSDKYGIYCEENAEKALMPIMDKLISALKNIAADTGKIDFYKAEKNENDLFYLYSAMAFAYASERYCKLPYPQIREKYDGNEWCYTGNMETGEHRKIQLHVQRSENNGNMYGFSHTVYSGVSGIKFRPMMYSNYIDACADIIYDGGSKDKNSVSLAIRDGYIVKRDDGSFFVTVPSFTREQKAEFDSVVEKHLAELMPEYSDIVDGFVSGYKKLFPKHLNDDADSMCQNIFAAMYTVIDEYAQRTGLIAMPSENCYCEVMVQHK